jgi:Calx-beta domain
MTAARTLLVVATVTSGLAGARPVHAVTIPDASSPSLIIGSNGLGMFAYYDRVNGDLMVGRCLDAACTTVTTSVIDSAGDVGRYPSITPGTVATLGPVISYEDTTNHRLKLALCADPACAAATTVVVAPDIGDGRGSAVVVGNDGRPLAAYLTSGSVVAAHCDNDGCTSVTTTVLGTAASSSGVDLVLGWDGLGVVASTTRQVPQFNDSVTLRHCLNQACTSTGPLFPVPGLNFTEQAFPSLAVGADGLPTVAAAHRGLIGPPDPPEVELVRCVPPTCTAGSTSFIPGTSYEPLDAAIGSDTFVRLVVRQATAAGLDFVRCLDSACATRERTCLAGVGREPSVVLDGAGQALVAHEIGDSIAVSVPSGSCGPVLTIAGSGRAEGAGGPLAFTVSLGPAQTAPVTVAYATADGTAVAGADYVAASGTITFPPGATAQTITVEVLPDQLDESDETFTVVLSGAAGAAIVDGTAVGTIVDDDTIPSVDVLDCAVVEGTGSATACVAEARLSAPYPEAVTVQYATANGTATAGSDYTAAGGVITFPPAAVTATVSVAVVGDAAPEPDETFTLTLTAPVNATLGDASGEGVIVDDDGTPAGDRELIHGSTVTGDLEADPGPTADQDDYRLAQAPYASYEVVLDAASGDAAPEVHLDRIAADGSTVVQTAVPVGTGTARSLRFQNRLGVAIPGQSIRVGSAACGTACGADDTYRLRAYETTASIPRFNNAASQVTVLVLQNRTTSPVAVNVDFWDAAGARRATHAAALEPQGTLALNTSAVPGLAGTSGSITVTHDGPYGALAGKAVALEPATGSSFDSPLEYRPR